MFSKTKSFVALSFVALATLIGCMKMDTTVTEPVLNIVERFSSIYPSHTEGGIFLHH